jgi:hypothetical protein
MTVSAYFHTLPIEPTAHFRLLLLAAVLRLLHQVSSLYETWEAMFLDFPFLARYNNALIACGLTGVEPGEAASQWMDALVGWEARAGVHLPLVALRAGMSHDALILFMIVGLLDEDGGFAEVFEALGGNPRPTVGLLSELYPSARADVCALVSAKLLRVLNPEAPRGGWMLEVTAVLWDVVRGDPVGTLDGRISYQPAERLTPLESLVLPAALYARFVALPALLEAGHVLVLRGPSHNGRRTTMGALAQAMGRGLLTVVVDAEMDTALVGALASALYALPVFVYDLGVGESAELPVLPNYDGPRGAILGMNGGLRGEGAESALTFTLPMPTPDARCAHWLHALPDTLAEPDIVSERYRLTSGMIYRAARLAKSYSALAGRDHVLAVDVRAATGALNRQALEAFAVRENSGGGWGDFAVTAETMNDLRALEQRCRHRERLPDAVGAAVGAALNTGVRALFNGPSGTGKTLAARLLASALEMELYRVDLGAVVNKYIGETEKNLNTLFARAEELDVILLLDEGDALLTRRTDVYSANDRYANLETNFLLQRLENYGGIVIVTTNAGNRIDSAFQRRMDAVIEFRLPDANERWAIWRLHLPEVHSVDHHTLVEIASRCTMTGGQIRNAALHAALLALDDNTPIHAAHLVAAVQREYRKAGEICPLRPRKG